MERSDAMRTEAVVRLRIAGRVALCAALVARAFLEGVRAQQPPVATARATLRIELAPYDDSPESVRQIEAVVTVLAPRRVTLPPNGTISALTVAEYGFGPTNLPRTYDLIQRRILALNGWTTPEQAQAGSILIPGLPSNVRYNPAIAWNEFPSVADFRIRPRAGGTDMSTASMEDVVVERVTDTRRRGASGIMFDLPLSKSLLRDPSVATLAREDFVSLPSEPLRVKFGVQDCANPNPAPILTAAQRTELAQLLKNSTRVVPLFVIDTGWPSVTAQKESWNHLRAMLQKVRLHFNLGASPAIQMPNFVEPKIDHCKRIERALEEFRSIDHAHVSVVYVPMSKEQGSAPLLAEMVEVADTVERITSQFRRDNLPASVPPDILSSAKKFAADVMRRVPSTITGEITETDKAIVESLVTLAAEVARLDQTFHIVNESWVVATDLIRYDQPSNAMGLIVAAAGNDGVNINVKQVDFAHRSSSAPGTFVAVMNVDSNGDPTCNSSSIDLSVLEASNAIGFSGAIAGRSATSYAAPRVGWLLAAAEAVRPKPIEGGLWAGQVQTRIKRSRTAMNPASLRMLLGDPVKLVRLWLD